MPIARRSVLALLIAVTSLACGDGSPAPQEPARRSAEEVVRVEESAGELTPVGPTDGRGGARERSEPDGEAAAAESIELDPDHPLVGRVVVDGSVPSGESAWVIVEVPDMAGDEAAQELARTLLLFDPESGFEAARVPLRQDLSFEAPRPVGATSIRLRVEGAHLYGVGVLLDDVPDGPIEVPAYVGARVRLRLDLREVATESEIAALAGRRIAVRKAQKGPGSFWGDTYTRRPEVDARGEAVVERLSPGVWTFERSGYEDDVDSLAPFCVEPGFEFTVQAGESPTVDIPMIRGRHLALRLVTAEGVPIEGALVRSTVTGSRGASRWSSSLRRTSDADGSVRFAALASAPESIVIEAEGFPRRTLGADEAAALLDDEDATIQMERGAGLRIRVVTHDGRPARGVEVEVTPPGAPDDVRTVETDDDGRASLEGLHAGDVRVFVLALEGDAGSAEFAPFDGAERSAIDAAEGVLWCIDRELPGSALGGTELTLTLRRAPMLTGHVSAISADWPDPVLVVVRPIARGTLARVRELRPFSNSGLTVDRATGSFSGQVAPGEHEAFATAGPDEGARIRLSDEGLETSSTVTFEAGRDDVELELAFPGDTPIVGLVESGEGAPVGGIGVVLFRRGSPFAMSVAKTTAAPDGRFEFPAQNPGTYFVSVRSERHVPRGNGAFEVQSAAPTPPVTVVVEAAGAARVTLFDPHGDVRLEQPMVRLSRPDGTPIHARRVEGDSDWAGTFAPLAPGTYVAAVHADAEGTGSGATVADGEHEQPPLVHLTEFEVVAGEVTGVDVHGTDTAMARVTGRIESGGEPVPLIEIWLHRGPTRVQSSRTDDEGQFDVSATFTGPATLTVAGGRVGAAATVELDLEVGLNPIGVIDLPGGRVVGLVPDDLAHAPDTIGNPCAFVPGEPKPLRYSGGTMNGRFEINHLPDGEYVIGLPKSGGGVDCGVRVTIENGETVHDVVLRSGDD